MIAQLNTKLLKQQWRCMQKNLIIFGLLENEKGTETELENLVDVFFHNVLHIDYNITYEVAHRLGKPKKDFDLPVVVRLNDPKDKQTILNNTNQLKDVKNTKGRLYYCNIQLPEELHENKCSYQRMI